jgi:DNA repair exonuclease SbcCD ATPase subunit
LVCLKEIDPSKGFKDVCTTSIIRDEMITQLSVDLAETERFAFVRAAVGSASLSATEDRLKRVAELAQKRSTQAAREYDNARNRVRDLVSEISRLRSETSENRDVQTSEELLRRELGGTATDVSTTLIEARKRVPEVRLKLDAAIRLLDNWRSHRNRIQEQNADELANRRQEPANSIRRLETMIADEQLRLAKIEQTLAQSEHSRSSTSSLAQLHAHGSGLGLVDGHCPLCGSVIAPEAFRRHLDEIEKGLQGAATVAAQLASERSSLQEQERKNSVALAAAIRQFEQVRTTVEQLEQEGARLREDAHRLSFTSAKELDLNAAEVGSWIENNSRRLSQLERAIAVLESSRLLNRVADVEKELAAMQKTSIEAERQLELIKAAERRLKDAASTLKRVASEQIDERLASISPLLSELYVRLRPHVDWPSINYLIRGDVRRFLSLRVGDGEGLNLRFMLSSGQRRAVGLAFLLSICLSRPWCALRSVILDDPVQHIDDYRALHLVEALAAVRQTGFQVICTVEDHDLAELLARRLRSTSDNPGAFVELRYTSGSGVSVERNTSIRPFPIEILKSA